MPEGLDWQAICSEWPAVRLNASNEIISDGSSGSPAEDPLQRELRPEPRLAEQDPTRHGAGDWACNRSGSRLGHCPRALSDRWDCADGTSRKVYSGLDTALDNTLAGKDVCIPRHSHLLIESHSGGIGGHFGRETPTEPCQRIHRTGVSHAESDQAGALAEGPSDMSPCPPQ